MEPPPTEKFADFETAISATKFGIFNINLLLLTIVSIFTSQFEVSSLSYAYPAAACDLNLTLEIRGLINALIYTGMIFSSLMWGPLVDVFGRKKILIVVHILDSLCAFIASFAPSVVVLMTAKIVGGFIINGAMALTPYLSEFHAMQYRARIPLMIGLLYNFGNIVLPLLAWAILPLEVKWNLGVLEIHSWNIYLFICALPGVVSGITFIFMPESPKYLMSKGNNEAAIDVFQNVFEKNTRKPKQDYPIKKLADEKQIYQKKHGFGEAWKQISPLFSAKYVTKLILVCLLMMMLMMCLNSLRLWLPEIFQIMNDYENMGNETVSFCQILATIQDSNTSEANTCSMNFDNASVYINSIYVALTAIAGYVVAAFGINKIGKKKYLTSFGFLCGISVGAIYFAPDSTTAIVLICIHVMCAGVCIDTLVTVIVDLFPTYLRGSAFSLALMFGRIGSVSGNLVMPILLQGGCAPTFFTLGSIVILCTMLSLFLPNTDNKALD